MITAINVRLHDPSRYALLVAIGLLVQSCASLGEPEELLLRDTRTGQVVNCTVQVSSRTYVPGDVFEARSKEKACVRSYRQAGFNCVTERCRGME